MRRLFEFRVSEKRGGKLKSKNRAKKVLPSIKKDIKYFLLSEEGKVSKKNIIKIGLGLAALGSLVNSASQAAVGPSIPEHQSSFYNDATSGKHGSHGSHGSHSSHGSHGSHSAHSSHGSHGSHGSHSAHSAHGSHASHGSHGSHSSHGSHGSW